MVPFRMDRGRMMRVQNVLFVLGLKYSVIFVSMMERNWFEFLFQDGKEKIEPRGSKSDAIVLRVREHGLYRLTGKPKDHRKKQGQVKVTEKQE